MAEGKPLASSPFSQTDLQPIEETFTRRSSHMGLAFLDGRVLVNFNDNTSYGMLKAIAKALQAEIVTVKGTWVFYPDKEEDTDE